MEANHGHGGLLAQADFLARLSGVDADDLIQASQCKLFAGNKFVFKDGERFVHAADMRLVR